VAKVDDYLKMWQGSNNLCDTQMESNFQIRQMTAVGYISDSKQIVIPSSSNFTHDDVAVMKLSEKLHRHQLYLQRTCLEDKHMSEMSIELN
jgi:hypothetical protein